MSLNSQRSLDSFHPFFKIDILQKKNDYFHSLVLGSILHANEMSVLFKVKVCFHLSSGETYHVSKK